MASHECQICGLLFATAVSLNMHSMRVHRIKTAGNSTQCAANVGNVESSTGKQQCTDCGRWFVCLSNHRKCSGRSPITSQTEVLDVSQLDSHSTSRRSSHSGIFRKDALKEKALQPKDKMLQVCHIFIAVTITVTTG